MRLDVCAAGRVDDDGDGQVRTKIRRKDDKGRRRRRGAGDDVTQDAFVRRRQDIRRDAVFELVNGERKLRQQQDRRNPRKDATAPHHVRHRTNSSARPRKSVK